MPTPSDTVETTYDYLTIFDQSKINIAIFNKKRDIKPRFRMEYYDINHAHVFDCDTLCITLLHEA